jgi:hypothetical protein
VTFDAHANLASGVVSVAPTTPTAGLTMTVVPDQGVTVPTAPFTAVVFPEATAPSHANAEIVRVSVNASGVWTMARAQEGTTARAIIVGDVVYIGGVTAKTLTDLESAITAAAAGAQPVDSDLTAIAALAPANDDVIQRKGGAWTNRSIAQLLVDLGLASLYQPLDADLTAIAALTTTPYGLSLLTQTNAAALRTLAGLVIGTDVPSLASVLLARVLSPELDAYRRQNRYFSQQVITYDFYVDSVNGLDSNNGTSPDTPWQTLSKVNASAAIAARVGLARGSVFRSTLTMPFDYMTIGAYGPLTAPMPKIKGSKDYSSATWTLVSGSKWQATITAPGAPAGAAFWKEDTILYPAGSAGAVTVGTYDITGTTFTIWLPDSSNPNGQQIEVTDLASGSWGILDQKNGSIWQDVKICHFTTYVMLRQPPTGGPGGRVSRCEIGPSAGQGINLQRGVGCIVEDSYFHGCWNGLDYSAGGLGDGLWVGGTSSPHHEVEVRYNRFVRCYVGITAQGSYKGLSVHHNTFYASNVNGVDLQNGTAGFPPCVFNNTVYHHPSGASGHGIVSQLANVGAIWRNNIVYSDFTGTNTNVQLYSLNQSDRVAAGNGHRLQPRLPRAGLDVLTTAASIPPGYKTLALWQAGSPRRASSGWKRTASRPTRSSPT